MRTLAKSLLIAGALWVLFAPIALGQAYGMGAPQVMRGAGSPAELVWRKTFNSTAPFGNDENGDSTTDCTTRGANLSGAAHFCEQTTGGNPEGDGFFLYFGGGEAGGTLTAWDSNFTNLTDAWIQVHIHITENVISSSQILLFGNDGANIGTGYSLSYGTPATDALSIMCDGQQESWVGGYTDATWAEYWIHMDIVTATIEIWKDDFTGSPDKTCTGAGGDVGAVFNGLRVVTLKNALLLGLDDIRIYDGDPR